MIISNTFQEELTNFLIQVDRYFTFKFIIVVVNYINTYTYSFILIILIYEQTLQSIYCFVTGFTFTLIIGNHWRSSILF